jgi:hypothetical protein
MASSRTDITDEVRANAFRAQAEPAYRAALNAAPPGHLPGESIASYRVRLATGLKPFSATYKKMSVRDLDQMRRSGALHVAEETIYAEATAAAKRPTGPLREVQEPDRTGRPIVKFYGSPEQCWAPFKQTPRIVTKFNTGGR